MTERIFGEGMRVALMPRVAGVTRYEDLDCCKLANELRCRVYEIVDASPAKVDFKFRDQLTDAASSGPSNIAEGFACYRHKESARNARIAKASLTETQNHLNEVSVGATGMPSGWGLS